MPELREQYPRRLTETEMKYLRYILPEDILVYDNYYKQLSGLWVIGHGRFGHENLVIGEEKTLNTHHSGLGSIFAAGVYMENGTRTELLLHAMVEGQAEFDIMTQKAEEGDAAYTLSRWKPGKKLPGSREGVREITLTKGKLLLACDREKRQFWIHEYEREFNRIIPATNLLNEIRFVAGMKGDLKPKEIFALIDGVSDEMIIKAFIKYNKLFKKIEHLEITPSVQEKQKSGFFDRIFKGNQH